MSFTEKASMFMIAVAAGFLGGMVSNNRASGGQALTKSKSDPKRVVTAQEFRLVDEFGMLQARLTVTSLLRGVSPAILSKMSEEVRRSINKPYPEFTMMGPQGRESCVVSLRAGEPSVELIGSAGRNAALLDSQFFRIFNAGGTMELNRSTLSFLQPRLNHELIADPRLRLSLNKDYDPSVELFDKEGKLRTVIGCTDLENVATGSTEQRSAGSIVLFSPAGKVTWKAP